MTTMLNNSAPIFSPPRKHFDTAYQDVLTQLYTNKNNPNLSENDASLYNLLLGPVEIKSIQNSHLYTRKFQEISSKKLSDQAKEIELKRKKKEEEQIQRMLQECKFVPEILVSNDNEHRRTLEQFLKSQNAFLNRKSENTEKLKKKLQENNEKKKNKPELCKESVEIINKKIKEKPNDYRNPTYERLYALNKRFPHLERSESDEKKEEANNFFKKQDYMHEEITFIPKINEKSKKISHNEPVSIRLYKDAEKLTMKKTEKLEIQRKKAEETHQIKKKENPNDLKKLAEKFLKEYSNSLQNYADINLTYISMSEILKELGFITNGYNLDGPCFEQERALLFELWHILKLEGSDTISKRNLALFLLAILGLSYKLAKTDEELGFVAKALPKDSVKINLDNDSNVFSAKKRGDSNYKKSTEMSSEKKAALLLNNSSEFYEKFERNHVHLNVGRVDFNGELKLNKEDIEQIHKTYQLFYRNRLYNEKLKQSDYVENHSYQPIIQNNANSLSVRFREKMLNEANQILENSNIQKNSLTHQELLILSHKAKSMKNLTKSQLQSEKEMENCTFKPKTLEYSQKSPPSDRNLALYSLSKQLNKTNKDPNTYDYQKNASECTFQPLISHQKVDSKQVYAKNIDKFIGRIRKAQKETEYQKLWKNTDERAFPGKRDDDSLESYSEFGKKLADNTISIRNSWLEPEKPSVFNDEKEKVPLLFVDVNIGPSKTERIIVNEGDSSDELAEKFAIKFNLDYQMQLKLKELLDSQISGLLHRIEEELPNLTSESESRK